MDGEDTELDRDDHGADPGPAHAHGPQQRRPWDRNPGRAAPRRQAGDRPASRSRAPRRRPDRHRDQRRRQGHRPERVRARPWRGLVPRPRSPACATRSRVASSSGRLLDRRQGHLGLRPRRRHGRGADQHRAIGGTVELKAGSGRGTTFSIRIPLDPGDRLCPGGSVGRERFAMPQSRRGAGARRRPRRAGRDGWDAAPVLRLRGQLLPLVLLGPLLDVAPPLAVGPTEGFVAVLRPAAFAMGCWSTASSTPRRWW